MSTEKKSIQKIYKKSIRKTKKRSIPDTTVVEFHTIQSKCNIVYNNEKYHPKQMIYIKDRNLFLQYGEHTSKYLNKIRPKKDICELFSNFDIKKRLQKEQTNEQKYPNNPKKQSQYLILVAENVENEEMIVGLAQFNETSSKSGFSTHVLYLDNICTVKQMTKTDNSCKLARILLEKLYEIARIKNISRIELKNYDETSASFYKYLGFTEFTYTGDLEHQYFYYEF